MKKIALNDIHEKLGAKMVPFAGYNMPVQYEGINIEHVTVRNGVGVFDVSHMGEFLIEGENALSLIQKVTSNDASKLNINDAQYSCMPNDKGGIVDDLIVYRVKESTYLLVVNASNIEKDWNWIASHNDENADMRNISDVYSLLAIQGPKAIEAMQSLSSIDLGEIPFYKFRVADFAGIEHVIISATGYTGSGGFEIYCKNEEVDRRLKAFELDERGIPRQGYEIVNETGEKIGVVTSGTMSPCLKKGIGLGYVQKGYTKLGTKIFIQIRKNAVAASIVKLPFYKV
jgi:aminomethyltransferase